MAKLVRFPDMRKRILKWRRDWAVARLTRNSQQLRDAEVFLRQYLELPEEERSMRFVLQLKAEIEVLRLRIDDDKHFIRRTA